MVYLVCGSNKTVGALLAVRIGGGNTQIIDVQADDEGGVSLGEAIEHWLEHGPQLVRGRAAAGSDSTRGIPWCGDGIAVCEAPWPVVCPQCHPEQGRRVLDDLGGSNEVGMPDVLKSLLEVKKKLCPVQVPGGVGTALQPPRGIPHPSTSSVIAHSGGCGGGGPLLGQMSVCSAEKPI
jgi:hypothetical protein